MSDKYEYSNIIDKLNELRKKNSFEEYFKKIKYYYNFKKLTEIILEQFKFHQAAEMFPLATEEELKGMARDIYKKGLIDKISTYNELIVDGRNRVLTCIIAGKEPKYIPLKEGMTPFDLAISRNVHRRHLKSAQKAELALRIDEEIKDDSDIVQETINKVFNAEEDDSIKKKVEFVREKKHLQSLARQTGTTAEKIKQAQFITSKAKTDKKIADDWEKAKKGMVSVERVYKNAIKESVKNENSKTTLAQINDKLRKELKEWKSKYHGLKKSYEALENKYRTMKETLQDLVQSPFDRDKKANPHPTPAELRKADLI